MNDLIYSCIFILH